MAAVDFTTVEVWTSSGLKTFYLLFAMELKTRKVHFAGCSVQPNEAWMRQTARELTNHFDGFLLNTNYLSMDRDTNFCESFRAFLLSNRCVGSLPVGTGMTAVPVFPVQPHLDLAAAVPAARPNGNVDP